MWNAVLEAPPIFFTQKSLSPNLVQILLFLKKYLILEIVFKMYPEYIFQKSRNKNCVYLSYKIAYIKSELYLLRVKELNTHWGIKSIFLNAT